MPKFEKLNLESKIQAAKVESSITSLTSKERRCMTNIKISQVYNRLKVDSIPSSSMRLQG